MKKHFKNEFLIAYILLSHLAGIIGLLLPLSHAFFVQITPFHLLIMFFLALYASDNHGKGFFITIGILLIASFIVEYLGVKTKVIFGDYDYDHSSLGLSFLGIPLVIGPNWVVLLLSSASMIPGRITGSRLSIGVRAGLSALFMVLLDFFIEPVAVYLHYWHWNPGPEIPFQNYFAWFVFSFVSQWFYQSQGDQQKNIPLRVLYISQLLFFLALNYYRLHPNI
jgi:putative membrane protein